MEESDVETDDFQPRDYQIKLMEIATENNTIIYLPTGTGKTFIAVMVLKRLAAPLERSIDEGGKISIMLVNTVALVDQQSKYIKRFTPFEVGAYTGDMNVDLWDNGMWHAEFRKHQVLVMTSQILVNLIGSSTLSLSDVNLLIFDECHRGVNDHAMRQIMKTFGDLEEHQQPRVMGLTATLLNKNCTPGQVTNEVRALETTFHSKVATVDELKNVIGFSTNPKEILKTFSTYETTSVAQDAVERLQAMTIILTKLNVNVKCVSPPKAHLKLLEPEKGLKDFTNLIKDTIAHINMFGVYGGKLALVAHTIQLERIKKHCQDQKLATILEAVMCTFNLVKKLLNDELKNYPEKEQIYRFSSPQVLVLFKILKEYQSLSREPLCGIVFVQRRFTAKVLYNVLLRLKAVDTEYEYLCPNFIVGFNNNPFNDTREGLYNIKMNKKVLNEFQNKEINLLVASNVLEEGVDIPMCSLVVKFDKPVDYRAYIQSKGRARHKSSFYYIMIDHAETEQFEKKYKVYQEVEDMLNYYLVGQNKMRYGPSIQQIQELYDEDELPPYYANGPGSAQVNIVTAISLLCRYCLSLPSDKYTMYSPNWFLGEYENDGTTLFKVVIELPVISDISEAVEGEYMKTKKTAKRAAALKACELLHKKGKLDDKLLPVRHDVVDEDTTYLFKHRPSTDEKDAGNMKKRRLHLKQIAQITKVEIKAHNVLYLHIIELKPLFTPNTGSQRMMYELYSSQLCFGILSSNPLPQLCTFSVYISMGEIMVDCQVNKKTLILTEEQILQLRTFHYLIFNDVLKVLKNFLMFNNENDAEGLLVVPILKKDNDYNIDFDVAINNTELVDQHSEPSDQEKLRMIVSEENYLGKIVTPWYRADDKQYLVTSVCSHMNALSNFPSEDFASYKSYFSEKYHTNVLNPSHPLLLVKGLSKRMNCLKPRHHGSKRNKEKAYEELEEHLIPELCIKQDFPSDLWIQATLLPSILHRINTLLQAEELRTTIANEAGLGMVNLRTGEKWLRLTLDVHLLNKKEDEPSKSKSQKTTEDEPDNVVVKLPKTALQQLTQDFVSKKLESEFPWEEKDEPVDVERHLDVTLMDIQYYENFMCQQVSNSDRLKKNDIINQRDYYPAITFDKDFIQKDILLLKRVKNDRGPELAEVFRALTTAKCNDIVNLERLETLGDSFLKLSISLFITLKFPQYNEGKATALKGRLISNKNLYYIGVNKKLPGYLNLSDFAPNFEWKPPGFCVPKQVSAKISEKHLPSSSMFSFVFSREEQISGNLTEQTNHFIMEYDEQSEEEIDESAYDSMLTFLELQTVPDKSVADSVEALLGAYFESCGFTGGLKLLEWLGVVPESEQIEKLLQKPPPEPILADNITNANIDFHVPSWRKIEEVLGYHFKNRAYLLQALTHSSYTPNRITNCYQTLEFLGDAILDFLITCHIYETCENVNPGQLTDLRSALVNNITFAGFTVRCGFHKFLLFSNNKLLDYINNFVDFQESKHFVIDDEVLILLEENDLFLSEHVDVPKVLGDIFEALAGAVFLDSGMNLETVWSVFYRIMWKEIELFRNNVPKNAIRLLYETVGAHPDFQKPVDVNTGGTMVRLDFMLNGAKKMVYGFGENKNLAKKAAAKIAVRLLHK